jgi:PAS domain S-box-containing protein
MNIETMSREELVAELGALLAKERERRKEKEQEQKDQQERDALIHDLRVHQVELELQNRELRETQVALEASRARFEELYDFAPVAYFTFDAAGTVTEVNLTGATMVGRERARLIGLPFLSLVNMADASAFWKHLERCERECRAAVSEMRFSTSRIALLDVQAVSAPVLDAEGRVVAFRTSFTDISALKRLEADLKRTSEDEQRLRRRFEALYRASFEVSAALAQVDPAPQDALLQVIVDEARLLVDAEFAALGVGGNPETSFSPFAFSGIDEARADAIGRLARPRGVLGEVIRTGGSLRLRDLREHPAFVGFPAHHPPMRSFLGVPVPYGGRVLGHLYFANKRSAEAFSEEDQRLGEMFASRAGLALETARLTHELRGAVEARENLLAVVSHDLRGFLSAIRLHTELMARRAPEGRDKQIDAILCTSKRMNQLIDDLLQAATIEAGTFVVEPQQQKVASIVEDAMHALAPLAAAQSVHLEREVSEGLPPMLGDRRRIVQVLSNLIGNAIKFTPGGGSIRVRAWAQASDIRFAVTDDGPGIPEKELAHVFERYAKGQSPAPDGVGLGLYIARGIVEAHGGRIWVESAIGCGATFYFTIPIAPVSEQHASLA